MSLPDHEQLRAQYERACALAARAAATLAELNTVLGEIGVLLDGPMEPTVPNLLDEPVTIGPLIVVGGASDAEALPTNGILATSGMPLLEIDAAAVRAVALQESPERKEDDPQFAMHQARVRHDRDPHLGTVLGDENNLATAGWAVVVHADEDAGLLRAITPLLIKRCGDQGLPVPPLDFRTGETCGAWLSRVVADVNAPMASGVPVMIYRTGESANRWLRRHGVSHGPVDPQRGVPFYLLLLGRPGPIAPFDNRFLPFSLQYELDLFWGVGRLCFSDPATGRHDMPSYAAYAEQLVASEQANAATSSQIVYFATRHDRSTERSADELVVPLAQSLSQHGAIAARQTFTQQLLIGAAATRSTLVDVLGSKPPALLFTATHGLGFPADDSRLPAQQGALLCQDWSGGPPQRTDYFAAEDVPAHADLSGIIAVCFACYSLACPQEDQFQFAPGQQRARIAPYPLVAQLPQQLLRHGALAVLGHVDRAWTHSFSAPDAPAQTQGFTSVLGRLMQGDRLGLATDGFNMLQGALASQLADTLEKLQFNYQIGDHELSRLWTARNDARNYALLGDPAARLTRLPV